MMFCQKSWGNPDMDDFIECGKTAYYKIIEGYWIGMLACKEHGDMFPPNYLRKL